MQTEMIEGYRRRNICLPPSRTEPVDLLRTFPLPCHLPEWLPDMLRSIAGDDLYEGFLESMPLVDGLYITERSLNDWCEE